MFKININDKYIQRQTDKNVRNCVSTIKDFGFSKTFPVHVSAMFPKMKIRSRKFTYVRVSQDD